jgi:hypothetical protein
VAAVGGVQRRRRGLYVIGAWWSSTLLSLPEDCPRPATPKPKAKKEC